MDDSTTGVAVETAGEETANIPASPGETGASGALEAPQTGSDAASPTADTVESLAENSEGWKQIRSSYAARKAELEQARTELEQARAEASRPALLPIDAPPTEWQAQQHLAKLRTEAPAYYDRLVGAIREEVGPASAAEAITRFEQLPEPQRNQIDAAVTARLEQAWGLSAPQIAEAIRSYGQAAPANIAQNQPQSAALSQHLIAQGFDANDPAVLTALAQEHEAAQIKGQLQQFERRFQSLNSQQTEIAKQNAEAERARQIGQLDEQLNAARKGMLTSIKVPKGYEWVSDVIDNAARAKYEADADAQTARKRAEGYYTSGAGNFAAGDVAKLSAKQALHLQATAKPIMDLVADNERLKALVGEKAASRREIPATGTAPGPGTQVERLPEESALDYTKRLMRHRADELGIPQTK